MNEISRSGLRSLAAPVKHYASRELSNSPTLEITARRMLRRPEIITPYIDLKAALDQVRGRLELVTSRRHR